MASIVLGPLLRHVGRADATIWVETDAPCEVEVLRQRARTFHVAGHHYALVVVRGLAAGSHPYEVRLDGERRWPEVGSTFPASRIRTIGTDDLSLAFGSCRVAAPQEAPFSLPRRAHRQGHGADALAALAARMARTSDATWPDALMLLGDQVYADAGSPRTRAFIRARRDTSGPHGDEVRDFEEYTQLYAEAWGDPPIRWLLSTVPSAMIFDDHDVHDDWNTSLAWKREIRTQPWWDDRIAAAFASYWVYQHLGNLSLSELAVDDLYSSVLRAEDAAPILLAHGLRADRETTGRWSYRRDLGPARLIVIDSRAGRVLTEDRRDILDDAEWAWIEGEATGDIRHLVLATSLPYLLPWAIHHLEAWDEAVAGGVWGRLSARLGERLRQALDLEHWAAFDASFRRLGRLITAVALGERGAPPASVVILSGDIHSSYLARVITGEGRPSSPIYQAVCSPLRNELSPGLAHVHQVGWSRRAAALARRLARAAGVRPDLLSWSLEGGPFFHNSVGTLTLSATEAWIRIERAGIDASDRPILDPVFEANLAGAPIADRPPR